MQPIRFLLVSAICGFAAGCSGSDEIEISGNVLLDGQPLSAATVSFVPMEGTKGAGGVGGTDPAGKFTLTNPQGVKKVLPGKYKVTVGKSNVRQPKEGEKMVLIAGDVKETLPPIYSSWDKTILTQTVEPRGKPLEIRLESKK